MQKYTYTLKTGMNCLSISIYYSLNADNKVAFDRCTVANKKNSIVPLGLKNTICFFSWYHTKVPTVDENENQQNYYECSAYLISEQTFQN